MRGTQLLVGFIAGSIGGVAASTVTAQLAATRQTSLVPGWFGEPFNQGGAPRTTAISGDDGSDAGRRYIRRHYDGSFAVGDLDGDGAPEIVTAGDYNNYLVGGIRLFKNDGNGNFVLEAAADIDFDDVFIADIDGDGVNELLGINSGTRKITIIPNELAPWQPDPGRAADLNGDLVVDGADLGRLLGAWGPVAPPVGPVE